MDEISINEKLDNANALCTGIFFSVFVIVTVNVIIIRKININGITENKNNFIKAEDIGITAHQNIIYTRQEKRIIFL